MSSVLNHSLFNHIVPLSVHEMAVKNIAVMETRVELVTGKNHSLVNIFKDLEKKVVALSQKVQNKKA